MIEPETIAKLDVQAGDVLVIKSAAFISPEAKRNIECTILNLFPSNTCLILDGGLDLQVARAEQA